MRRLLLVANPAASGFTGALHREAISILSEPYEVTSVWPTSAQQANRLATQAAADGFHVVVAFGGDGVAHHVAAGLIGSGTGLGLIPAGSTNVLAKNLGIPRKPRQAAEFIATVPRLRGMAVARLETGDGVRGHTLFAAGIGYDAEVVQQAEREPFRKLRFGAVHYARSAGWVLWSRFRDRLANLRVTDGERQADGVAVLIQVGHAYTYLGRFPLSFVRRPSHLSVLVFERLGALHIPSIALRTLLRRRLDGVSGVHVWTGCREIRVDAEPPAPLQSDGELLGQVDSARIRRIEDGLLVAAPLV